MKVLVAGATGAVGKRLVPLLVARGHDVIGTTTAPAKVAALQAMGARGVVADGLDRDSVLRAVRAAEPDVIVHQMSGLAGVKNFKQFDREFALTNRLRMDGTDNLLAAAGGARIVAQSFGNWNYEPTGTGLKSEEDALDPNPPANQRKSLAAIRYVEDAVLGAGGIALRYASFYGPGTGLAFDGDLVALVRKRRLPIVGSGAGVWGFIHMDDAATATVAAIERGTAGIYNIADDEPAPVSVWLPELAAALEAKPPRRVPVWLGRLAIGEVGVSMMTRIHGPSNAKAKRELGWRPYYASWRDGFRRGLGEVSITDVADRLG